VCAGVNMGDAFDAYHKAAPRNAEAIAADPQAGLMAINVLLVPLTKYANALKLKYPGNALNDQLKTTFKTLANMKANVEAVANPWQGALECVRKVEKGVRELSGKPTREEEWKVLYRGPVRLLHIAITKYCERSQAKATYGFVREEFLRCYAPVYAMSKGETPFNEAAFARDISLMTATLRGLADAFNLWKDHMPQQQVPGLPPVRSAAQWKEIFRQQLKGPPKRAAPIYKGD